MKEWRLGRKRTNGGDGRDNFAQLELVQDSSLSRSVKSDLESQLGEHKGRNGDERGTHHKNTW